MKKPFIALRRRIEDTGLNNQEFAETIGIKAQHLCYLLCGRSKFNLDEADKLGKALNIPRCEYGDIFWEDK
ncbi:MAG: helix-turn-helix transcriptional regulator [Oscillospiraceae bacterium]